MCFDYARGAGRRFDDRDVAHGPAEYVVCAHTEIGVGLVSGGLLFLVLGIVLFFDATLLALGNVLFLAGIALLIGPQKTLLFFARPQKVRGTVCFFAGMALVFVRWTVLGMLVELIGFLNLFGYVILLTQRLFPCDSQLFTASSACGPIALGTGCPSGTLSLSHQVMDQLAGARRSAV